MNELAERLSGTLERYLPLLQSMDTSQVTQKPNPKKWSNIEILGHLVDSAANNHQRFIRIQDKEDLIFGGYDQDGWVMANGYQDQKWPDIVSFWYSYNKLLANVIRLIPDDILLKQRKVHNLDRVAFRTVPNSEPTTLHYFINDYIDHIEHHMRQILGN